MRSLVGAADAAALGGIPGLSAAEAADLKFWASGVAKVGGRN